MTTRRPTLSSVDLMQRSSDLAAIGGPNQTRDFLAVAHEDQGRPKPDLERATQWPAAAVGDLEVSDVRVIG
jgi:hypothetical protein